MKKQALKTKWERYFPPGFDIETELGLFIAALVWSSAWSIIGYFNRLLSALHHDFSGSAKTMPYFYEVLGNAFFWFPIAIAFMLLSIIMNYSYHHSGSKSIYLMRRIPSKWELHRRCMTAPMTAAAITVVIGIILFFVYYAFYELLVPEIFHPHANQLKLLWENWRLM